MRTLFTLLISRPAIIKITNVNNFQISTSVFWAKYVNIEKKLAQTRTEVMAANVGSGSIRLMRETVQVR